jgi:predicted DNA-binding transcriptional regulator AlpA
MTDPGNLLHSAGVRTRYGGVSDMSLWRWLNDKELNFPKPLVINKRRYWRIVDLVAWERAQADKSATPRGAVAERAA